MKRGRDTGWTSHEMGRIYLELRRGNKKYQPDAILCTKCKSGYLKDIISGEVIDCPNCLGYGILRKD